VELLRCLCTRIESKFYGNLREINLKKKNLSSITKVKIADFRSRTFYLFGITKKEIRSYSTRETACALIGSSKKSLLKLTNKLKLALNFIMFLLQFL
jgi:hypothetical protein